MDSGTTLSSSFVGGNASLSPLAPLFEAEAQTTTTTEEVEELGRRRWRRRL